MGSLCVSVFVHLCLKFPTESFVNHSERMLDPYTCVRYHILLAMGSLCLCICPSLLEFSTESFVNHFQRMLDPTHHVSVIIYSRQEGNVR